MNDEVRYGAGGVPYVGAKKVGANEGWTSDEAKAFAFKPQAPEVEKPTVTVAVIEDDRPLTDEQVVSKVTGKKGKRK